MNDSGLTAGDPPLPIADSTDGLAQRPSPRGRLLARARQWTRPDADTLAVFDAFLVLGLLGLYLKVALLGPQWEAVARFLGLHSAESLGWFHRVGFFASDITLNLLLVPVTGTVLLGLLFGRRRVLVACAISAVLSLVYFIELRASSEVGQYISGEMLHDFIGWSATHPTSASDYLTAASLLKLVALMAALCAVLVTARAARRTSAQGRRTALQLLLAAPVALALMAVLIVAPFAYATRLSASPLTTSAIIRAATSLMTTADGRRAGAPWPSLDDALNQLRHLTRTPPFDRAHALVGTEAGSDLVVMMMETGPAAAFDYQASTARRHAVERLRPRALLSPQHYTAHPYSSDALFAVLSGTYPLGRRLLLHDSAGLDVNGLFSGLPADVSLRGIYLPSLYKIEMDDRMYGAFGARTLYVADRHLDDPLRTTAARRADGLLRDLGADRWEAPVREDLRTKLLSDLQALERAKVDIAQAIASGSRYAVMFFPEIGHGPWSQLRPGDTDVLARGRLLMDIQDAWLDELLDVIAAGHRLDRTVVTLTADHGLRTRAEYPALRVGFLNDVMFRVPLLIYAPHAVAAPTVLQHPTSHIDLAPTLLALLGAPDAAARMHGIPVWQRSGRERLYLLASAYGGADGFEENGRFYMHQVLSGAVYASDQLSFGDSDQARPGDPVIPFVVDGLAKVADAEHALVTRLRHGR